MGPVSGCLGSVQAGMSLREVHEGLLINASAFSISGEMARDGVVVEGLGHASRLVARHVDGGVDLGCLCSLIQHF